MNKITRIGQGLRNLTHLEKLHLYGNQISFLEGLEGQS